MSLTMLGCHAGSRSSGTSALARCFRVVSVVAVTAQTWRFTTAPHDHYLMEEDGAWHLYQPKQAVIRGTTKRASQMQERSSELHVGITDASFTADDVTRRFLDGAIVTEFLCDFRAQHRPPMQVFRWRVLDWTPGRDAVKLDLGGISNELGRDAGSAFMPGCSLEFAGPLCDAAGIIVGDFTFAFHSYDIGAGTHSRNRFVMREENNLFPPVALTEANWWAHGKLRCTTGDNDEVETIIESNTQPVLNGSLYETDVVLVIPLPFVPIEGELLSASPGCDRSEATCKNKFGNLDQRRGFGFMPGSDYQKKSPEAS